MDDNLAEGFSARCLDNLYIIIDSQKDKPISNEHIQVLREPIEPEPYLPLFSLRCPCLVVNHHHTGSDRQRPARPKRHKSKRPRKFGLPIISPTLTKPPSLHFQLEQKWKRYYPITGTATKDKDWWHSNQPCTGFDRDHTGLDRCNRNVGLWFLEQSSLTRS
jgi:hypothetical protein